MSDYTYRISATVHWDGKQPIVLPVVGAPVKIELTITADPAGAITYNEYADLDDPANEPLVKLCYPMPCMFPLPSYIDSGVTIQPRCALERHHDGPHGGSPRLAAPSGGERP